MGTPALNSARLTGGIDIAGANVGLQAWQGTTLRIDGGLSGAAGCIIGGGSGLVILNGLNPIGGTITHQLGTLQLGKDALLPAALIDVTLGARLSGWGEVQQIKVTEGDIQPGIDGVGAIKATGSLTLTDKARVFLRIDGPLANTQYGQLLSNGLVALGGAQLFVTMGYAPNLGTIFEIVRRGSGTSGVFDDLAENDTSTPNGVALRINYNGGATSRTTTLTSGVVTGRRTTLTLSSAPNPAAPGTTVSFSAVVAVDGGGTPTGSIAFRRSAEIIGEEPIIDGTATFEINTLPLGAHTISADYIGRSGTAPQLAARASIKQTIAEGADDGSGSDGNSNSCSPDSGSNGGLAAAALLILRFGLPVWRRRRDRRS